jgi:hypothetical protein
MGYQPPTSTESSVSSTGTSDKSGNDFPKHLRDTENPNWPAFLFVSFVVSYLGIANMVFAIRNPRLTETQRFLMQWQAITWQQVQAEKEEGR